MLKEFFALKLMDEMGLPTPQYGLAKLYINGNYYGVYAMVEALDESILEQYYGVDGSEISSYLCKPEETKLQREQIAEDPSPLWEQRSGRLDEYISELHTENMQYIWHKSVGCDGRHHRYPVIVSFVVYTGCTY